MAEESHTPLEKLLSQGKELGYSGEDLRKFVDSQQKAERDERAERRKVEWEHQEMQKKNLEIEIEKIRLQTQLRERELALEQQRARNAEVDATSSGSGERMHDGGGHSRNYAPRPKLPCFSESSDSIDAYISRFEVFAQNQGWPEEEWAIMLSALLTGKALQIFSSLTGSQQTDFLQLKHALMKGYDLTAEGFRKKFRQSRVKQGETFKQFGARIEHYFVKWLSLSACEDEFDDLKELVLREQILSVCSPELQIHLREKQPSSVAELLEFTEVSEMPEVILESKLAQVLGQTAI